MYKAPIITTGILTGLFATSSYAQNSISNIDLEEIRELETCITQAIDAIDVPNTHRYYDPEDHGHKKYMDTESIFAGVTGVIDPTGAHIGLESNSVAFFVKYYDEGNDDPIDYARHLEFWLHNGEVYNTDHGHTVSYDFNDTISDFDAPRPKKSAYEEAAVDWVTDSANTLGLHFTICMNFEPYEPGGWAGERDVVPPVFPVPEN